jgi:zinc transporter ZupT
MEHSFWFVFGASLIAGGVTTAGILAVRRIEVWARDKATYFAGFAAGVLIAISFLHLLPQAIAMSDRAPIYILLGYLAMLAFNRFLSVYVCDKPETAEYAIGLVPLIAIGFHSFLDGVIYSVSFSVSLVTGALVALGMILHEFPEGIVTYSLLLRGGFTARWSLLLAIIAASLTTPLGTAVSYPIVAQIERSFLGDLLAVSAGALIYVGATHLLPQTEKEPSRYSIAALAAGIIVAVGIVFTQA